MAKYDVNMENGYIDGGGYGNILRDGVKVGYWQLYADSLSPVPDVHIKDPDIYKEFWTQAAEPSERMFKGLHFFQEHVPELYEEEDDLEADLER